jgi:hypothetical protein
VFTKADLPKVIEGMDMAREMREYIADNGVPSA